MSERNPNQSASELSDEIHEQILLQGQRRFPLESYRQLVENGTTPQLALTMLGWRAGEPGIPTDLSE